MPWGDDLRDRIVAADAGLTRLFMAARTTASVGTALAILLAISRPLNLPLSVALVGAALCITWSVSVSDPDSRNQRITMLLMWVPAAGCVAIGTMTSVNRFLCDALFLVVLFCAVYTRRYGPRATALGMVAVLGFFFSLYLQSPVSTLPWLVLAVTVAGLVTYFYRFVVFRDRPEAALHSAVEAFQARQRLLARTLEHARRSGSWTPALTKQLDHHLYRLNEAAIVMDDLLLASRQDDLRAQVLDAELETGAIAERALSDPKAAVTLPHLEIEPEAVHQVQWTPRGQYRVGTQIQTRGLSPSMRQAIQITAAAAASMVAGEMLSPQRWYWAVLTSFLVFNGTASTGETLVKGWSRVAGTALGAAAGAAIGTLVRSHDVAAFILMFVFLFVGVYVIRISYAIFTFFLTALLSMLYVLVGLFSDQLLILRLIETAVGAACGGIAATVLLPIRTTDVLGNVSVQALERLTVAIDAGIRRLGGEIKADPLTSSRTYDEAMQSVRAQIEPMLNTLRWVGRSRMQTRVLMYALLGRYVRGLSILAYEAPPDCDMPRIRSDAAKVITHIRQLIQYLRTGTGSVGVPIQKPPSDERALTYLYRMDRSIHRLAAAIIG